MTVQHDITTDAPVRRVPGNSPVAVFLLDDHELVRRGLREMIGRESDFVVCGEAGDIPTGLQHIAEIGPDLVLSDIALPESAGLEFIRRMRESRPFMRVLVVSTHDERLYGERVLRAGAMGFVSKAAPVATILDAMRTVMNGWIYVSRDLDTQFLSRLKHGGPATPSVRPLSDREVEVLRLIGDGLSTRDIAEHLHLSAKTVHTHREHIMQKLAIRSAQGLVRYAVAQQLLGHA